MSNNYFIADIHYGHNGISEKFRTQFSSDEEHDSIIHQNILDVSGKRNHLWLLGDLFFKQSTFWRLDELAQHFGTVKLVLGNHEHNGLVRHAMQHENVQVFGLTKKYGWWLSHAPIHPCELYRGLNVHGHTHYKTVGDPRYFCVSCEQVDYKPIDIRAIREHFYSNKEE